MKTTIFENVKGERERLATFTCWWMTQQDIHGKTNFPDTLEPGDWNEQFHSYEDSRAAEESGEETEEIEKILACPYCGSEGMLSKCSNICDEVFVVTCSGELDSDCVALSMNANGFVDNADEAIRSWNKRINTFPNPLMVRFGSGRILMSTFDDEDGYGIVLQDSGKIHPVGEDANLPTEKGVMPKNGEIYLHFTNMKSALALQVTLDETMKLITGQKDSVPPLSQLHIEQP